jgi:hypothetical protein
MWEKYIKILHIIYLTVALLISHEIWKILTNVIQMQNPFGYWKMYYNNLLHFCCIHSIELIPLNALTPAT